jgi:hypothetical protein
MQHDADTTNSTLQFFYPKDCKPMDITATTAPANPFDYNRT